MSLPFQPSAAELETIVVDHCDAVANALRGGSAEYVSFDPEKRRATLRYLLERAINALAAADAAPSVEPLA
jgi:hypothetical protein